MKHRASILAAIASLTVASAAGAEEAPSGGDPRPSTGSDVMASGIVLSAIGVLSFASSPICKTGVVAVADQGACFTTSFVAGTPFIALGIPLIVYGALQHGKFVDWARRHPTVSGLSLSPAARGGAVAWSATF
jgi:hypothetical protein